MDKKRRPRLSPEQKALLATLHPAVEITPLIRPRLLLVASLGTGQLILGLLYHTRKEAWQWRVRVRAAVRPGFSQRSRWRQYADAQARETHRQALVTEFTEIAVQLGAQATVQLEFPPQASDDEILQSLWSSLLPARLP